MSDKNPVAPPTNPAKSSPNAASAVPVSVRSRNRQDPQLLDLNPKSLDNNRHYRWVRSRGDENHMAVTKHKLRGYRVEKTNQEGGAPRTLAETDKRPDGVISIGDLILMSCPVDQHKSRQDQKRQRREAILQSTAAETKQMARDKGVVLMEEPSENRETKA